MTTAMKAAFTLTLEDKLSSGLGNIQKQMEQLRNKGSQLNLGKLEKSGDVVRTLAREIQNLTSDLRGIEAAADRGFGALRRMASVQVQRIKGWGQNAFGPGGFSGATGAIAGVASGVSLVQPVRKYADYQNIALHSAITQGLSGQAAATETNRLMALFNKDALETGQSSTSIAQAFQDLIQTGMTPKHAEGLLGTHSRAATAYNITPEALGHAVFALSDSFKIGEEDMPGALASMAQASKEGRFKVEDFSHFLPSIGGDMAKLGMTGRGSADRAFSALETVMRYSAEPGSGAANFTQFLNDLTAPHTARQFALHNRGMAPETAAVLKKYHVRGINLPALLEDARHKGISPIEAVLRTLDRATHNLPPDVKGEVLGAFFPNMQARTAVQSMLDHREEMEAMRLHLGKADSAMLGRDFETAHSAPKITLATGEEAGTQLERRAGVGFEPIVSRLVKGLEGVVGGVEALDKKLPGLADAVFNVTGAMLAGISALAAAGFVAPAVKAGASLMGGAAGSVLRLVPEALPAVALGWLAWKGSEAERDPATAAAREQLARERRSLAGGPNDTPHDGFGIDGRPIEVIPPISRAPSTLDITIHTDPGTTATINRATDGIRSTLPDVGNTVTRP